MITDINAPIATPEGMSPILTLHFPLPLGTVEKIMRVVSKEYGKTAPKFISNGGPTAVIFAPLKPEDIGL